MVTKTITVTNEAYERLKGMKEGNESFSEAIIRISGKRPLSDFYGILRHESAEDLRRVVKETRKGRDELHAKRLDLIRKRLDE